MFYELLTGDVPFRADAPVQVALKHLREEIPLIRNLNPQVPQFIENIIIKATAKNKANRYSSCSELLYDLDRSEQAVANERLNFGDKNDLEKTRVTPSLSKKEVKKMEKRKKKNDFEDDDDDDTKKPIFTRVVIGILLTALSVGAVLGVLYITGIIRPKKPTVELPNLIGVNFEVAKSKLEELGVHVDTLVVREVTDNYEKDEVFEMSPAAGTEVEVGTTVKLKVSEGRWKAMPDYMGWDIDSAKQDLFNQEFSNITINTQPRIDPTKQENIILEQTGLKAGDIIDPTKKYQVTFIYSSYLRVAIPGVVGQSVSDAENQLKNLGVKYQKKEIPVPTDPITGDPIPYTPNRVEKIDPDVGTMYIQTEKSVVTIYYYK